VSKVSKVPEVPEVLPNLKYFIMLSLCISKDKWFKMSDYWPHRGQGLLHNSKARFRVVVAGRRWGKSLSAAKEAEAMILTPGTRGWVVSKTYDLTRKVIREIYDDLVIKSRLNPLKNQMSGPIVLEFPWGSSVEGKSAEHPESLLGEGLDWLIFDECAKCKALIWEQYLRPTLTDREGWALFITTPSGYNWVYDLWKRGNDPDYPEWESFKSPSWENPHLSREDIDEAQRTMSEAVFMQEYGADFTLSSGQVYKEFDHIKHVLPEDELVIDPDWPRFRSIDFGYENPFVCLYITVDPEDRVIIYDEYYQRHRTMEQHARNLRKDNARYEYTVCDPSGVSARATLLENGIPTVAVRSNILYGMEAVRQQLRIREDGRPGLYVSSRCVETIREFNLYSYPDGIIGEEPAKEYDHCMDALRYFIVNWRRGHIRQRTAVYK
jgi:phage terminase large subunit